MSNNNIRIFYIYLITNNINKKNYIGQRYCPLNKTPETDKYMGSGTHLSRAKNKYGLSSFSKEILAVCYSKKEIDILEKCYIKLYREIGKAEYNHASGGDSCDFWNYFSEEETKRIYEQRTKTCKLFWNSPEGLAKKKELSDKGKQHKQPEGTHWYNNGTQSIKAKECPVGFVPGRLGNFSQSKEANQKRSNWYNSLTEEQRHVHNKKAADARKGKPKSNICKSNISKANKGRKYYNNGIIEVMQFEQPEGFVPGRLPSIKKKISEGTKKRKNSNMNNKE